MKLFSTIALASVLLAGNSFAATFESIEQMSDSTVNQFSAVAQGGSRFHHGDTELAIISVGYTLTNENESPVNTIKQLIYSQRGSLGEFSRPEFVHVTTLGNTYEGVSEGISAMLSEATKSEVKAARYDVTLREALKETLDVARGVKIYTVQDGNSWGRCSTLVLFDEHEMQIELVSSCWSE